MLFCASTIHKRRSKRRAPQQDRVREDQRIEEEIGTQAAKPMRQARRSSQGPLLLFHLDQTGAIIHLDIVKKLLDSLAWLRCDSYGLTIILVEMQHAASLPCWRNCMCRDGEILGDHRRRCRKDLAKAWPRFLMRYSPWCLSGLRIRYGFPLA